MKIMGYILLALGLIIGIYSMTMDTSIEAGGQTIGTGDYSVTIPKTRVNNIGLMEDRRMTMSGAGISLLIGAIFVGFGTLAGAAVSANSSPAKKEPASPQALLLQRFISGSTLSPEEVEILAKLAAQDPLIVRATNRTNGNSLLHLSASYGLAHSVELLLQAGADKAIRNGSGLGACQVAKDDSIEKLLRTEG